MMLIQLIKMEEITYTLHVTNEDGKTFQLGKELSSPKKIVSALRKTAYPPDLKSFTNRFFIKHVKTVVSTMIDVDPLNL